MSSSRANQVNQDRCWHAGPRRHRRHRRHRHSTKGVECRHQPIRPADGGDASTNDVAVVHYSLRWNVAGNAGVWVL